MKEILRSALMLCIICSCGLSTNAQVIKNDDTIVNQWASDSLQIDGDLKDWGDSLKYFNENTNFSFNLRNNNETIYLAIKSRDKQNLSRILARGISFSINSEGKKKPGATVIFPLVARSSQPQKPTTPNKDSKEVQKQILKRIQQIFVTGFPEIIDGPVSMKNTYGISAAAGFDTQDNLIVEVAIPFSHLGFTAEQNLIACLIEINGVKPPRTAYDPYREERNRRNRMYGYPTRDYNFDRRPGVNKQNLATGFWIKSALAKNLNN